MIVNAICLDKRVNELSSDTSRLAFTWLITFVDREGRTYGDPAVVRSMLFPRRDDISIADMTKIIQEWHDVGLIVWYQSNGDQYIWFPTFEKNQLGLRKEREASSRIPEPPKKPAPQRRSNAGVVPEQVPVKLNDIKLNESAPDGASPQPKESTPKQQALKERREILVKHFLIKTHLPVPKEKTEKEIKAINSQWWTPLEEIYNLAGMNIEQAQNLIDLSLARLNGLTISSPNSIIKTARAIYAELDSGKGNTLEGYTYVGK